MFFTGMVSVTFRNLSIEEIVNAASRAGLDGIEWGGDIHVPHGDYTAAQRAASVCEAEGLRCLSYGSYYRAGRSTDREAVIKTALKLGAPNIRIWSGVLGSAKTSPEARALIVSDIILFAAEAQKEGLSVSFEWHSGTLTDNPDSALLLLDELGNLPNVFLYWQPDQTKKLDYNLYALRSALPALLNLHVFNWDGSNKYPLRDDNGVWGQYLDTIRMFSSNDKKHGLFLEFSPDNTLKSFLDDAKYLKSLLA